MNKQPEALRLAKILEDHYFYSDTNEAAAELRRLHAENADFRATCDHLTRENAEQIGEIVALKEQRDELLAVLQALTHSLDYADLLHDDQRKAFKHARSAIAKGEES